MIMSKETLIKSIREIPDFPIPGILFYDVTTLFKDPWCLQELSDVMYEMYKDKGITKVVGIESRGFIMGPILATRLNAGFIPIRKPGKLPAETIEESYDKEYGKDTIQIHRDAIKKDDKPEQTTESKRVTATTASGEKAEVTVTVTKDTAGKETEASAEVTGTKAEISADMVSRIVETAGTDHVAILPSTCHSHLAAILHIHDTVQYASDVVGTDKRRNII